MAAGQRTQSGLGRRGEESGLGRIEETDNLLQVLRRTAHGFTNPTNFAACAILLT